MNAYNHIILCAPILGGAEIFTLERMSRGLDSSAAVLHCNTKLAEAIRQDRSYDRLNVVTNNGLDGLAGKISFANIGIAARGLDTVLHEGATLLGNLRAAALALHPSQNGNIDSFVHDNCYYLNTKARILISLIVARSRTTYFPCRHATLRIPFGRIFTRKVQVEYFDIYNRPANAFRQRPEHLKIAVVGRIEAAKNQLLALQIANALAAHGVRVELSLLGTVHDRTYYDAVVSASRSAEVTLTQQVLPRSAVSAFLKEQDLLLHTSLAESLPLVLFEANALGLPVFALPVGGIPEVLPRRFWISEDPEKTAKSMLAYSSDDTP